MGREKERVNNLELYLRVRERCGPMEAATTTRIESSGIITVRDSHSVKHSHVLSDPVVEIVLLVLISTRCFVVLPRSVLRLLSIVE
jgi:hypothetical protein